MDDALILRVAARFAKAKSYKLDRAKANEVLRRTNDPSGREESKKLLGGYEVAKLMLVPLTDINIPEAWHPARLKAVLEALDAGKALPPIRLDRTSQGAKWEISDGIHRTNGSKLRGFTHVPAIVYEWVETPGEKEEAEPEKPKLPLGAWVKLHKPDSGRSFGWVAEHVGARVDRGVRRWVYNLALVKPGDTWSDFVDLLDTEFEPVSPPSWGGKMKALIESKT
jgi:hypothetical protein